jgi:uncharacterized ParB-like nuclease family protein
MTTTTEIQTTTSATIRKIDTAVLRVDETYQRALGPIYVTKIARDFDPMALGVLEVSDRGNNGYVVIDGQHRLEACHRVGHREVDCKVHVGLSREREAELFLRLNFERQPAAKQRFAARVVSREPQAKAILDAAADTGFTVTPMSQPAPDSIAAIAGLDRVYELYGGPALRETLGTIRRTWPTDSGGRDRITLLGMALLLHTYPGLSTKRLSERLSKISPIMVHQRRQTYRADYRCSTPEACARVLLQAYNHGLQANRLPNLFDNKTEGAS